jgi:hypothetical protein
LSTHNLTKNDYLIICGDTGFMWSLSEQNVFWLDWFDKQKFTTLFVDGNHENFDLIEALPIKQWNGGHIHYLRPKVIHLMRGQYFNIKGTTFFTFGGGDSLDKAHRTPHISWWEREAPSTKETDAGLQTIENHEMIVDYILTHSLSGNAFHGISNRYYMIPVLTSINHYFNKLEELITFKHWYAGHYHIDYKIDAKHTVVYTKVIKINLAK